MNQSIRLSTFPLPQIKIYRSGVWREESPPMAYLILLRELGVATLLFILTRFILHKLFTKKQLPLPPGPKGYPLVGALPLLGNMPHSALAKLSKQYGPVMYLKMGTSGMVVASTPDSARAFLKTLDINFSNRPPNAGATHLAYNSQDMVFADYGPRWKLLRKLSNLHMLGGKAIEEWSWVRENELGHMINGMKNLSSRGEAVEVPDMLTIGMANMIGQVMLGNRVFESKGSDSNEFKDMVVELMTTAGYFNIGDFIPSIAWMDLQGIEKGMKKLHKKWDALITKMIDEHVKTAGSRKGKPSFLDHVMANTELSDGERLNLVNIKALILNLFSAGTDTSSSIIEWALSEMLYNPKIMQKLHTEMDTVIGRNRRLLESDIPNLPYLTAVAKETFRKHPSTPLNLPRVSTQPCQVNGYYIPKGTRLSVNIWAIGRDPDVWENPESFTPERFLTGKNAKIDPRGNDFELIPFGAGRRICAGTRMGIVLVEYILGTLVHSFDWKLPAEVKKLDMEEVFGLALQKAVPLKAIVTPRLEPHVYAAPQTSS